MRGNLTNQRRSAKMPEDKILGMVLTRLRIKLGIRYEDISEWTVKNGKYIAVSCLCDMGAGRSQNYQSRIPMIARYFQEVHGLFHVTCDYLLMGDEIEKQKVEREKEVMQSILNQEAASPLPLEDFIERAI